jgi:hypothetical protein
VLGLVLDPLMPLDVEEPVVVEPGALLPLDGEVVLAEELEPGALLRSVLEAESQHWVPEEPDIPGVEGLAGLVPVPCAWAALRPPIIRQADVIAARVAVLIGVPFWLGGPVRTMRRRRGRSGNRTMKIKGRRRRSAVTGLPSRKSDLPMFWPQARPLSVMVPPQTQSQDPPCCASGPSFPLLSRC